MKDSNNNDILVNKELSRTQKRDLELMEALIGDSRPDIRLKILNGESLDIDELLDFPCDNGDGF